MAEETPSYLAWIRRYPQMAWGGLACCILAVGWVHLLGWIPQARNDHERYQAQLHMMHQSMTQAQGLEADLMALDAHMPAVQASLMQPQQKTRIFSYFLELEKGAAVRMSDPVQLEVTPPPDTHSWGRQKRFLNTVIIKYKLKINGPLPNILQYMHSIDQGDYYSRITGVKLTRPLVPNATPQDLEALIDIDILGQQEA
jgi:hypothetical protein